MPKKWLAERWMVLLPALERASSEEEIKELCEAEIAYWKSRPTMKSKASLKTPMTDTRNAIEELPLTKYTTWVDPKTGKPTHLGLKWMNYSEREWQEMGAPTQERLEERRRNRQFIDKPGEVVERAEVLLHSQRWEEIAVGLAAVSGRRLSEVLKTASFHPKSQWTLSFDGQLKQKDKILPPYEIPTLVPADLVLSSWQRLREVMDCSQMEPTAISEKYSPLMAETANHYFADLIPQRATRDGDLYTHLFRSIYGRIAVFWFAPPTVLDLDYMAFIAGHWWTVNAETMQQKLNFSSTLYYFDYVIGDGTGNIDGRQGIRLSEPGVKVLDAYAPKPVEETVPESRGRKGRRRSMLNAPANELKPKESKTGYGMLKPKQKTQARFFAIGREEGKHDHDEVLSLLCDEHYELRQLLELLAPVSKQLETKSPIETMRALINGAASSSLLDQRFQEQYQTSVDEVEVLLREVGREHEKPVSHLREMITKKQAFREKKVKRETEKNYAAMPFSELRGYKTPEAAEERFRRAVQAIMNYNDRDDIQEENRWFISAAVIVDLVGGKHEVVRAYLEAHKEEIDAHHNKHGLLAKFNRSKPVPITKRIQVPEDPSGLYRYQVERDEAEKHLSEQEGDEVKARNEQ